MMGTMMRVKMGACNREGDADDDDCDGYGGFS